MRFIVNAKRSIYWVFGLSLLLGSLSTTGLAVDFATCQNCHQAELDAAMVRSVVHEPFMQKKCAACHALANLSAGLQTAAAPLLTAKGSKATREKVSWLAESSQLSNEHSFVFPADQLGSTLVVDLRGEQQNFPRQELALPLLRELSEAGRAETAPRITSVELLEVKRGVFLSVLIGWQTDSLTDSRIDYGIGQLDQQSKPTPRFGRSHQVRLYDLKPDQRYQYQIVATDLFGRVQKSELLSFTTDKPFARQRSSVGTGQEIALRASFERLDRDYLVRLQLNQPVSVFVGSLGEVRDQQTVQSLAAQSVEPAHDGLSSGIELEIAACLNCHRDQGAVTHPVNVLPKPGMTIPPEYPTLPDGRISCVSCHQTHSSDNPYLSIRRGKRELCVGCHKDML